MKFWGWIYHDGVRSTLPGYGNEGQTFKAREAATAISETNPVLGMLRMGADSEEQTIMNNLVELYNNMTAKIITASTTGGIQSPVSGDAFHCQKHGSR